jgi:hypothetical protein
MIGILCEDDVQQVAQAIADDLAQAYGDQLQVQILSASVQSKWPVKQAWDDLLIVLYKGSTFPGTGTVFMQDYLQTTNGVGFILPVALFPHHTMPPVPISRLKAILLDDQANGPSGQIARRVGALLGLRLRHRDTKVFISYRAVDGHAIAQQLYERLEAEGFKPWLDKAQDAYDGAQNIPGGADVQTVLEVHLRQANLVLLVDTPGEPESRWIKLEIDTANAHLMPILPVCCRTADDHRQGPRFRALRDLQRWVDVTLRQDRATGPLEETELAMIIGEMETYLCELYRRKLRMPHVVSKQFHACGFTWTPVDLEKHVYESIKRYDARIRRRVLSHCSVFDEVYAPALRAFVAHIAGLDVHARANFNLFIYDGEILPAPEIEQLYMEESLENVVDLLVLHHQELLPLLASDFKRISP